MDWDKAIKFEDLLGKTLKDVTVAEDYTNIVFRTVEDNTYTLLHEQDCCESVYVEDINGDLEDLLNSPLLQAEVISNSEDNPPNEYSESFTWTFYKLATIKGYVTIRWLGESNGYYSESVGCYKNI